MKKDLFYAIVFLAGIFLYCFLTQYEIAIVSGVGYEKNTYRAFRLNRMTGKAWSAGDYGQWIPIKKERSKLEKERSKKITDKIIKEMKEKKGKK
ncbi:hypothetical protein ACFL40_04410 [candidate division KSB1 bacterium]